MTARKSNAGRAVEDVQEELAAIKAAVEMIDRLTERLIQSELARATERLGLIDLDDLRLVDTTKLHLNAALQVEGLAELVFNLRSSKPYLFKGNVYPVGLN